MRAAMFSLFSLCLPFVINPLLQELFDLEMFVPRLVIAEALYFLGTTWALALVITSKNMLQTTNTELLATQEELSRLVAQENAAARRIEERVSRVLHGPIQDAIALSLRRLHQLPADYVLTDLDLHELREPITKALSLLEGSQEQLDELEETLDELVALWSGDVQIDVTLEAAARDALSASEEVQGISVEIIREAISNAIRHGNAAAIAIILSHDVPARDIVLTVTNNGMPLPSSLTPGVGTRFLQDFSHNWTRLNVDGAVVLTARVPLDPS